MADQALSEANLLRRGAALLSLDAVYLVATLVLLGLRALLTPLQPYDFWWQLATGRLIVAEGAVPTLDSFSFTRAGEPFYNQSWLAQLIFYWLYQAGGLELILVLQSLVLLTTYGLLLWLCIRRSGRLRLSVAVLLLATLPLSFSNWNVRPQSYAFLFFVGYLLVLTEYRLSSAHFSPRRHGATEDGTGGVFRSSYTRLFEGRLWLLPPLMALWVNIHGSFVLGGALIGLVLVGEAIKRLRGRPALSWPAWWRLVFWGAVSAAALLLNPHGPAVLGYVSDLLGSTAVTRLVTEWTAPSVRDLVGISFFSFLIASTLVLIYARRPPDLTDMLLYLAFLWLALGAVRNLVWFGLIATPFLVTQAATILPPPRRSYPGLPALNSLIVGLLLLLYCSGLPWIKPLIWPGAAGTLLSATTPVAATKAMHADPRRPQRLFHAMGYGSYLIWAAPEQKVFIDPRIELYPYAQWQDYIALSSGYAVEELLASYRIDGLLLDKNDQDDLVARIQTLPAWQLRYEDDETVYYVRR